MLYVTMLRCRALEARARLLSEQGRFPFPNARTRGQEAAEVACTIDLRAGDSIASADRDFIFKFIQGMPLQAAMARLDARATGGEETGASSTLARKTGEPFLNTCGPFGIGARLALANGFKENGNVVVAFSRVPLKSLSTLGMKLWLSRGAVSAHSLCGAVRSSRRI